MPAADNTWDWLEELSGETNSGVAARTPNGLRYVRKLGASTRDEIGRLESKIKEVDDAVTTLPMKVAVEVAKLTFNQEALDREEKAAVRKARAALMRKFIERFFDAVNILFGGRIFTALFGLAFVLAAAGIFAGQTGVSFTRDGLILDPSHAADSADSAGPHNESRSVGYPLESPEPVLFERGGGGSTAPRNDL